MYCSNFPTPLPHCSSHSRTCAQLLAPPIQLCLHRVTLQSILAYRLRRQVWKESVSRQLSAFSLASVVSGYGQLRGCLMAWSRVRSGVVKISMNIRSGVRQGGEEFLQLGVVCYGVVEGGVQRSVPEDANRSRDGLQVSGDDIFGLVLDGCVDRVDELVFADLTERNSLAQCPRLRVQHQLIASSGLRDLDLGGSPARNLVSEDAILAIERAQFEVSIEDEVDGLAVFGDLHIVDDQIACSSDEVESQDVRPFVEGQCSAFVMSRYCERVIEGKQSFLIPSDVANRFLRS